MERSSLESGFFEGNTLSHKLRNAIPCDAWQKQAKKFFSFNAPLPFYKRGQMKTDIIII